MKKTIYHQSEKNTNWPSVNSLLNLNDDDAKITLIIGSFNPYNNSGTNADYYYGRNSNYFWKIISKITENQDDDYYTASEISHVDRLNRKKEALKNKFICLDLIKSIDVNGEEKDVDNFIQNHVLKNFFDSKIFTSIHRKKNVIISRAYDTQRIVNIINSKKIKSVIHTLGGRINSLKTSPSELSKEIEIIRNVCNENDIEFIFSSESPSQINVNRFHFGEIGNLVSHYRSLLNL